MPADLGFREFCAPAVGAEVKQNEAAGGELSLAQGARNWSAEDLAFAVDVMQGAKGPGLPFSRHGRERQVGHQEGPGNTAVSASPLGSKM